MSSSILCSLGLSRSCRGEEPSVKRGVEGGGAPGADRVVPEGTWDSSSPGLGLFACACGRATSSETGCSFLPSLSRGMSLCDNVADPTGTEELEGTLVLLPTLQTRTQGAETSEEGNRLAIVPEATWL